jgi:hemerythrin
MATATDTAEFPVVPDLHWSADLVSGDSRMDATHHEFVEQLAELRAAPVEQQLGLFRDLTRHTQEHFDQEDRWMVATGFSADNCHASQHKSILETMQAVETHFLQGDQDIIARMADALAEWFPQHAQSMDAGLAQHMARVKFDSQTETLADPSLVRPATMSGCGSVSCS